MRATMAIERPSPVPGFGYASRLMEDRKMGVPYAVSRGVVFVQLLSGWRTEDAPLHNQAYMHPRRLGSKHYIMPKMTTAAYLIQEMCDGKLYSDSEVRVWLCRDKQDGIIQIVQSVDNIVDWDISLADLCSQEDQDGATLTFYAEGIFQEEVSLLDGAMLADLMVAEQGDRPIALVVKRVFRATEDDEAKRQLVEWSYQQTQIQYLKGCYPVSVTLAVRLSAIMILIRSNDDAEGEENLQSLVRDSITSVCLQQRSMKDWMDDVSVCMDDFKEMLYEELKLQFLESVHELPYGNSIFVQARRKEDSPLRLPPSTDLLIAVNMNGLHFFILEGYQYRESVGLHEIVLFNHNDQSLALEITRLGVKYAFELDTPHGRDICELLDVHFHDAEKIKIQKANEDVQTSMLVAESAGTGPRRTMPEISDIGTSGGIQPEVAAMEPFSRDLNSLQAFPIPIEEINLDASTLVDERDVHDAQLAPSETRSWASEVKTKKDQFAAVNKLENGSFFGRSYVVSDENIEGKPSHIVFATNIYSKDSVVLKFYKSRVEFENCKKICAHLASPFICRLLDAIETKDGSFPPCLVFERGDCSLDQWMKKTRPDALAKKAVIYQCLRFIHSRGIVHCNLKPSNIVFFASNYSWKLMDFEIAVERRHSAQIQYIPTYACPEVVRNAEKGQQTMKMETSADMWSFGVVAYEILTGMRFYGSDASDDAVKKCLCGKRPMPRVDWVEELMARKLIKNVLRVQPRRRWTAIRALRHVVFQSADETIRRMSQIESTKTYLNMTTCGDRQKASSANLMIGLLFQDFTRDRDACKPFHLRTCQDVLTMTDPFLQGPVFVLKLKRDYRLKLSLVHKHHGWLQFYKIKSVTVKPLDGQSVELEIARVKSSQNRHEVVALFKPERHQSKQLSSVSPGFGSLYERYVSLEVTIDLEIDTHTQACLTLTGKMFCKMVSAGSKMKGQRFDKVASRQWEGADDWIRQGTCGAVIMTEVASQRKVQTPEVLAPKDLSFLTRFWHVVHKLVTFD